MLLQFLPPLIHHAQVSLVLTLRPDPSTCWGLPVQYPNPSSEKKLEGVQAKERCNEIKRTHPHIVGALEEQLIKRFRLLAPNADQTTLAVGAIYQAEPIPLHARGRPE